MSAKRNRPDATHVKPAPEDRSPKTPSAESTRKTLDAADVLAGVYVTVVQPGAGHVRRRVYLSLAPAERAARAAEARGQVAAVVLCRLVPVGGAE